MYDLSIFAAICFKDFGLEDWFVCGGYWEGLENSRLDI
jgi:hypothetical protein